MSKHTTIYNESKYMITNNGLRVYKGHKNGSFWPVEWKHIPTDIKIEALKIRLEQITDWQNGVNYYAARLAEVQAEHAVYIEQYAEADQPFTAVDFGMEPRL